MWVKFKNKNEISFKPNYDTIIFWNSGTEQDAKEFFNECIKLWVTFPKNIKDPKDQYFEIEFSRELDELVRYEVSNNNSILFLRKSDNYYSESYFEFLALKEPEALLDLIESKILEPCDLTFAAEYCNRIQGELQERTKKILLELLKHSEAVVREGALFGIYCFIDENILEFLRTMEKFDSSMAVRQEAADRINQYYQELNASSFVGFRLGQEKKKQ